MSGVSYRRFILLNLIGASVWAVSIGLAGYYFGHAVEAVLGDIKNYELQLMLAMVGLATLIWLIHFYWRHRSGQGAR